RQPGCQRGLTHVCQARSRHTSSKGPPQKDGIKHPVTPDGCRTVGEQPRVSRSARPTERPGHDMELDEAVRAFRLFCGPDLRHTLSQVEAAVKGTTSQSLEPALQSCGARLDALIDAGQLKRIVGQINVVIHALGTEATNREPW